MKYLPAARVFFLILSPPTRGAWIEIATRNDIRACRKSPPTRGAWIEMEVSEALEEYRNVAPHTGGVD